MKPLNGGLLLPSFDVQWPLVALDPIDISSFSWWALQKKEESCFPTNTSGIQFLVPLPFPWICFPPFKGEQFQEWFGFSSWDAQRHNWRKPSESLGLLFKRLSRFRYLLLVSAKRAFTPRLHQILQCFFVGSDCESFWMDVHSLIGKRSWKHHRVEVLRIEVSFFSPSLDLRRKLSTAWR